MPEITTIIETLAGDSRFIAMSAAVYATDMIPVLTGKGPFTVLAPVNDAFQHLRGERGDRLLKDPHGEFKRVLQYHVLFGMLVEKDIKKLNFPKTRLGTTVEITERAGTVTVNGAHVIHPDIICSNGVIHGIDTVLIPR
ncbi:MAG: fasciclin domain-containing protein [Methanoregula sp.]|nr:fasciclin domain-containing protein [Methanoregula sp.]